VDVTHFTSKLSGGASIAALRLHNALRRRGVASVFYYGAGDSSDPTIMPLWSDRLFYQRAMRKLAKRMRLLRSREHGYVNKPTRFRKTPHRQHVAIANLHSLFGWADLPSFLSSLPQGTPIVWSLHDLEPVTGGCIYPGTCDRFCSSCGNCPQLKLAHRFDTTYRSMRVKERIYSQIDLHLVGNSAWTTEQAARSSLARYAKSISTISLGLDVENFRALRKDAAREALGIAEGKYVIGFACSDVTERRKGAHLLIEALKLLPLQNVVLLVFGNGQWPKGSVNVETISLGHLTSPRLQSLCYSAIDVLAMPSLVETFGMVAMEAMACETPVAAYKTGGLVDLISDMETGLTDDEVGSVAGLVRMLEWFRAHPRERLAMGKAARRRVCDKFTSDLMAERYDQLYGELLASSRA
jgi:glycosyltransferase involved in cell wall biosynthesis